MFPFGDTFRGPPFPPFWPPQASPVAADAQEFEPPLQQRQVGNWIKAFASKTFSASVSLTSPFVSTYSGSSAVSLTDGGGHVLGAEGVLIFPAGTATSVSWTGAWATVPGSETFTAAEACAVYMVALDRIHITLKRVVLA
jgi:hypothetical protein